MTTFRRLILVCGLVAAPAAAQTFEDLDALQGRVVAALGAEIGEPGGPARPLDRRLKLAACPEVAVVEAPALGAVAVRCQPIGWRIRVPLVKMDADAGVSSGPAVKQAAVVRKGDQVELRAGGSAFQISMVAIAEEDGAEGARIRVRGSEPKSPVVIAQVDGPGRVFLPGFK